MLDLDDKRAELLEQARRAGTAELLNDLGAVEAVRGAIEPALTHLRAAALLAPDNADVRANLDMVLDSTADGPPIGALMPRQGLGPVVPAQAALVETVGPVTPVKDAVADGSAGAGEPLHGPDEDAESFGGHYHEWRRKRLRTIVQRYGADWFAGARVLELGCGHGDIGVTLLALGADVTFSEGRPEHLQTVARRYPGIPQSRLAVYDAEDPWPFQERFDLVINMGLIYHVDNWQRSIIGSLQSADQVVLETEVCDSDDPTLVVKTAEAGPDQAISGVGSRPSAPAVEALLRAHGFRHERVSDSRCNAGFHRYDWPVTGSGGWDHGLRRFWFAWRSG